MTVKEFMEFTEKAFKLTGLEVVDDKGNIRVWEYGYYDYRFIIIGGENGVESKSFKENEIPSDILNSTILRINKVCFKAYHGWASDVKSIEFTIMRDYSI